LGFVAPTNDRSGRLGAGKTEIAIRGGTVGELESLYRADLFRAPAQGQTLTGKLARFFTFGDGRS
jgi:hypothetical protein